MDLLFAQCKSLQDNTLLHCIANGKYTRAFPVADKSSQTAADCPSNFMDNVSIPQVLWTNGAKEYQGCNTTFRKVCNKHWIDLQMTEPGQKNQNHAVEREIGELKKRQCHRMAQKDISKWIWDYGMVFETELMSQHSWGLDGRTGSEKVTETTPNISEYCNFEFNDLVWFRPHGMPNEGQLPGELSL